jgi:hypothetical protein
LADKEIKVIKVDGKQYAVGLFWQPVQNDADYMREVRVASQSLIVGANLYCFRRGASSQYGLGFTSDGQKAGMPSGASAVASALRDKSSAICVLKVDEGWWFITIRNNLILSEEDTVYKTESDAQDAFNSMLSIPDWGYKIAPASWKIEDTKELSAAELLGKGSAVDLKHIGATVNIKVVAVVLALAAVGAYLYHLRLESERKKKAEEEARRLEFLKKQMEKKEAPPPPAPKPWESLIDPSDMAKKCTILIVNSTATVPGWELTNSTCTERTVTSNFKRTYGTASWLFEAQRLNLLSNKIGLRATDTNYNMIVGTVDIPMVKRTSAAPAMDKAELQKSLTDRFHSLKIDHFKLEDRTQTVADPNAPPPDPKAPRTAKQKGGKTYPYTNFTFTDVAYRLPLDWVKMLENTNSLEFTSIKWDNVSRKWSYEGKIFERVDEPAPAEPVPAPGGAQQKQGEEK